MTSRTKIALITIIVVIIVGAGAVVTYLFRDQLFTAVGTGGPPGQPTTIEKLINGSDNVTLLPGESASVTVRFTATGGGSLWYDSITDDYDENYVTVSNISNSGVDNGAQGIVWSGDILPVPVDETITYTMTLNNSIPAGTVFTNTATIVIEPPAPSSTATVTVGETKPPEDEPELTMTKDVRDVNGAPVERGDLLEYTVTLSNIGQGAATDIRVTEDIPLKLEQFSVPVIGKPAGSVDDSTATGGINGTGYLDVNSFGLLPGDVGTIVYTTVVSDTATNNEVIDNIVTAAYAESDGTLQATASVTVIVPGSPVVLPGLTLVKNVVDLNGAPVERGDTLEYTVTVGNNGAAAATDIQVVEDIPEKLEQFSVPVPAKPKGATDDSTAAGGIYGNGYLDVNSFSLLPTESGTIVYTTVVSNTAADNEVIDNVVTATYSQSKQSLQATASVTISVPAGPVVVTDDPTTPTQATNTTTTPTTTPTQPVVVPEVGIDPSMIALGGSGAASVLVGAGYFLRKRRKIGKK